MRYAPEHPDQNTFDDFKDESADDEIEKPDGIEERMLDGSELTFDEEGQ